MGRWCMTSVHNALEEFGAKESKVMGPELIGKVGLRECLCLFVLKMEK